MPEQHEHVVESAHDVIIEAVREAIRIGHIDLERPENYRGLIEVALSAIELNDTPALSEARLHTLTAMAAFGPDKGLPSDEQCKTLEGHVTRFCANTDLGAIFDLVAAFGCGWQRDMDMHSTGWDGLWEMSFQSLRRRVQRICYTVSGLLTSKLFLQFPTGDDTRISMLEASNFIAKMLIQPSAPVSVYQSFEILAGGRDGDEIFTGLSVTTDAGWHEEIPTGTRAVYQCVQGTAHEADPTRYFQAGDEINMTSSETRSTIDILRGDGEVKPPQIRPKAGKLFSFEGEVALTIRACTCGREDCAQVHELSAWNPAAEFGSLENFLFNAIKGPTTKKASNATNGVQNDIKAKAFASNMLGSFWARHGCDDGSRLRPANVVHHACMNPACQEPGKSDSNHYYAGNRCDLCEAGVTDDTPIVMKEDWLIVVGSAIEEWEFKEYWRCGNEKCALPGLKHKYGPLIDANKAIERKARKCGCPKAGKNAKVCDADFFGDDAIAAVTKCFSGSETLLKAAKKLNELRERSHCQSCNAKGAPASYCSSCTDQKRIEQLPRSPRWLFARAKLQ